MLVLGIINDYNKPESIRAFFKTDNDYESFMALIENIDGYTPTTKAVAGIPVAVVAGAVFFMGAAVIYAAATEVTVGVQALVAYEIGLAVKETAYVNSEVSNQIYLWS